MVKFNEKIKIYIALGFIGVFLIPIIINYIMTINVPSWMNVLSPNGVSKANDWIGFYGSFLGSFLGGVLTLGGVILTIKEQRIESIIGTYPLKMRNLDKINDEIERYFLTILNYYDDEKYLLAVTETNKLVQEKETFMELASEINGEFYYKVKYLFQVIDEWQKGYYGDLEDRVPEILDDITKWKMQFEEMCENYSNIHEELIKKREPKYFK